MGDLHPSAYFGIPAWIFLFALALLATFAFWWKTYSYIESLAQARPDTGLQRRNWRSVLRNVLWLPRRRDEPILRSVELLILWAALAHTLAFFWNLLRGTWVEMIEPLLPAVQIPYANDIPALSWALAVFAAAGLAGLALDVAGKALSSRQTSRKPADRLLFCLLAAAFACSITTVMAPVSMRTAGWWIGMLSMAAFLAYIPFSRSVYILFAPIAALRTQGPSGVPASSCEASGEWDFTSRELLGGLACQECHRCETLCAAFESGIASPHMLMQSVAKLSTEPVEKRRTFTEVITPEQLWACDTCGACMAVCPSFNEHVPLVIELRRRLVADGQIPNGLAARLERLRECGNSFGLPPADRARWTEALDFDIPDARSKLVEYLWFVGDYASFHPRAIVATQAAARVLHRAGIDFGLLYESESHSGHDIRRVGAEELYRELAARNRRALAEANFEKIVTTDPHSYHVLKHEYEWNGRRPAILHITELLAKLCRTGRLPFWRELKGLTAYQDPCYLGRYNGIYEEPRRVLAELGLDLVELPGHHELATCCGAGGGRVWLDGDPARRETAALPRLRAAASIRDLSIFAVACPKDLVTFSRALATADLERRISVKDIAELVDEGMQPTLTPADRAGVGVC